MTLGKNTIFYFEYSIINTDPKHHLTLLYTALLTTL